MLPVGVAEAAAWRYAFVCEIVQRHFPDLPVRARPIGRAEARRALMQRYLDNVVAAERKMIATVFHVLKWTPVELDRTIAALLEVDTVREMRVEGSQHPHLVSTPGLECDL